ncbi:MAG: M56 family metallopeptidase [Pirellulaceae bacterium]|jgi:hypothetical protein|nr:M56 family metallopeptidase [Pirellulaceae bacterium]
MNEWMARAAHQAPALICGSTAIMAIGIGMACRFQTAVHRQRIAETAVTAAFLWCVLLIVPLPRWTGDDLIPPEPVAAPRRSASIESPPERSGSGPMLGSFIDWARGHVEIDESAAPPQEDPQPVAASTRPQTAQTRWSWRGVESYLSWGYLAGVGICGGWLVLGRLLLTWRVHLARPAPDWLQEIYGALPYSRRRPRLVVSPHFGWPFSCGVFWQTVVLPEAYCRRELSDSLRHVLLHELVHAEKWDARGRFLLNIGFPVFYIHPLYWRLRWQAIFDAELVADDRAARHSSLQQYASGLVHLIREAGAVRPTSWATSPAYASWTQFSRRINMLMVREDPLAWRTSRVFQFVVIVLAIAALGPGVAIWGVDSGSSSAIGALPDNSAAGLTAPAETILPPSTKSFFSIPNLKKTGDAWRRTQLGKLTQDPLMKPFIEDLDKQIDEKLAETKTRLGITWEDVKEIYAGEICLATVQPDGDAKKFGMVLVIDVTGRDDQVAALLKKIDAGMRSRKAERKSSTVAGASVVSHTLPREKGERIRRQSLHTHYKNRLIATDDAGTLSAIIASINGDGDQQLGDSKAFRFCLSRANELAKNKPHVRWFIEPLGFAQVNQAAKLAGKRRRGKDRVAVLQKQGFSAVAGAGGVILFDQGSLDARYHAYVYAPARKRELAVRILDFPNSLNPTPPAWLPDTMGSALSFNWKMLNAFDAAETLVNAMAGDEIWEDLWDSIKNDPNGPMIDVRRDLISQFDDRVHVVTKTKTPIDVDSEQTLVIIKVRNEQLVAKTIADAVRRDPTVTKKSHRNRTIWHIDVDAADDEDEEEEEGDERLIRHMAITVTKGYILAGSDLEILHAVIDNIDGEGNALSASEDYKNVVASLEKLGAKSDSFRAFAQRSDTYHTNYELLRQGKLPQAETMLAQFVGSIFAGGGDRDPDREQEIDGSKLPPFESVKKYFRPGGFFVQTEDDGWVLSGGVVR